MSTASEVEGRLVMADGVTLRYTWRRAGSRSVVLVVPGILMHRESREHEILARRMLAVADVVTLDVRGHGDSGGAFTFGRKEPADVATLATRLRDDYARVGGLGFSFGGFHTAVAAALHRPFDAVALVAAPRNLFIFGHNFLTRGLVRSGPLMLRRQRRRVRFSLSALGRRLSPARVIDRIAPTPLLVAHGADDWLVPVSHARALYARALEPKRLLLVEHGLHAENMLVDDPERLLGPLLGFFAETLGRRPPLA